MNPDTTCWTLIRGAAGGDGEDRNSFARLYLPVVRSCLEARWRASPLAGEVEDAVQVVFLECCRDGGALEKVWPGKPGSFRSFLYTVVKNVAHRFEVGRARSRARRAGSRFELSAVEAEEEGLASAFDRAWLLSLLDQALALQEDRAREKGDDAVRRMELLRLRHVEDVPIRDIARRFNEPADRMHYEYRKARMDFVKALEEVLAFQYPDDPEARKREFDRLKAHVK